MNFNCTFCHCYATPFLFLNEDEKYGTILQHQSPFYHLLLLRRRNIERWQSPFPTVYVLAMLQQYLQAFSWLKFCSCSWEQESILMPDTSSQTTISGTRMQQHARSIKISSISLPRRFYFWYYYLNKSRSWTLVPVLWMKRSSKKQLHDKVKFANVYMTL